MIASLLARARLDLRVALPLAILAAGVVGVLLLVVTRSETKPEPRQTPAPLVRVAVAEPRQVRFVVRTHGSVVPRTESRLVAQVAGEVEWVSPSLVSGGFFDADEPLVRIEAVDYDVEVESARAALARAESEFARAEKELRRQRSLARQSVASEARIDDAENAFRVAEAVLREARARLVRAERDLERTTLSASFEGRVRSEEVDVGQFVTRGQALATVYAVDVAEVRLPLPDRELRYVDIPLAASAPQARAQPASPAKPGAQRGEAERSSDGRKTSQGPGSDDALESEEAQAPHPGDGPAVTLRAEFAGEERTWRGRVVRTEGEIDPRSRMVNVVARVVDPYGRHGAPAAADDGGANGAPLAVGLFVEAEIEGRSVEDAVVLPRGALREDAEGRPGVYVVDAESRLRFRPVRVLRSERDRVVIGEGLARGERVNVSPLAAAVEGMRVRVVENGGPDEESGS